MAEPETDLETWVRDELQAMLDDRMAEAIRALSDDEVLAMLTEVSGPQPPV